MTIKHGNKVGDTKPIATDASEVLPITPVIPPHPAPVV
jgi:hypothetical protein